MHTTALKCFPRYNSRPVAIHICNERFTHSVFKMWPLTQEIYTVVSSGESKAQNTKNICKKTDSNEEHFYSVLTEAAGKWRYKGRSDRLKEKKVRREIWELPIISTLPHCVRHTRCTLLCTNPKVCAREHARTQTPSSQIGPDLMNMIDLFSTVMLRVHKGERRN